MAVGEPSPLAATPPTQSARIVHYSDRGVFRGVEPPLQLMFHMPYALIATVCVAGAVAGHVILTRRLLESSAKRIAPNPAAT